MAYNGPATLLRTDAAIQWFANKAEENAGVIPPYSSDDLIQVFHGNDKVYRRSQYGKVLSRLDYICYKLNFPPIGLIASQPPESGWNSSETEFEFPLEKMRKAAKERVWTVNEFKLMVSLSEQLWLDPKRLWSEEHEGHNAMIQAWANGLLTLTSPATKTIKKNVNPAWGRDELILALHLYMKFRPQLPSKHGEEVAQLSRDLNRLAGKSGKSRTFRNVNGVYMKVMNFLSIDPDYVSQGKKGLQRNNKDEVNVWNLYADDPQRLETTALQILAFIESDEELQPAEDGDGYVEAEEGGLLTRVHKTRERSGKLIREFKARVKQKTGTLICEGCGFESADRYGPEYMDTMEAHHTVPVHTLKPGDKTKINDLAILCANCHRIVHARKKWLNIDELRHLVASRSQN
jgi:predicted HNH restriction endonuclease